MTQRKKIEELVSTIVPISAPTYNMGLLPDEEGYNETSVYLRQRSEELRKKVADDIETLITEGKIQALKKVANHNNSEYTSDYVEAEIATLRASLKGKQDA